MAENDDTLKCSTTKVFGSVGQKILDRISWYSPFLFIDFFATGKILKHSTDRLLYEMVRHCETKNFSRKILTPPPSHLYFFETRNWWKTKGFTYGICRHCETKFHRKKSWYFPLPLIQKLIHPRNFLKRSTEGFLYEMLLYCETKSFRRKIVT